MSQYEGQNSHWHNISCTYCTWTTTSAVSSTQVVNIDINGSCTLWSSLTSVHALRDRPPKFNVTCLSVESVNSRHNALNVSAFTCKGHHVATQSKGVLFYGCSSPSSDLSQRDNIRSINVYTITIRYFLVQWWVRTVGVQKWSTRDVRFLRKNWKWSEAEDFWRRKKWNWKKRGREKILKWNWEVNQPKLLGKRTANKRNVEVKSGYVWCQTYTSHVFHFTKVHSTD